MTVIKVPRAFFDDHAGRDLPTPNPVKESRTHVWLDLYDRDLPELVNDALYYADINGPDCNGSPRYRNAALALLKALDPLYRRRAIVGVAAAKKEGRRIMEAARKQVVEAI